MIIITSTNELVTAKWEIFFRRSFSSYLFCD